MVMSTEDPRFAGVARLYGIEGLERLKAAHVAIVGVGGVGSWAAEALARSAVGHITLIDLDMIAESNVNRQIHAVDATIGQAKVEAMRDRIAQINSECKVLAIDEFVEPGNWLSLLDAATRANGPIDAVIDACDEMRAKLVIAAWARSTPSTLCITVGAAGGKRHAHRVEIDDLSLATHDPLLAQLRQRLRKQHDAPREGKRFGLACVFSRESVVRPDASCAVDESSDGTLNCQGYGSTVSVTATFGQCAAGWVLDKISTNAPL